MRRRLYFLLPDLPSARKTMDDLLLARIEERHIHFLARPGIPMEGLHECNVLQSTDLVHGAQTGLIAGAVLGCVAGGAAAYFLLAEPSHMQIPIVIGAALVGALLGAWFSSMVGSALPNSRLKQFEPMIAEGKLLLMVDVPGHSVEQVKMRVGRDHPEAVSGGTDPHIPAFP
jgi:hypothetical protein